MSLVVSARHVEKRYGKFQALQDASLELGPGEILALLGPNGAGKTTFIKILVGLIQKDGGHIEILGLDLDRQLEAVRHRIGYVGQDSERSAYARLTVWENLNFFGALRGLSAGQIRAQAGKLAANFDFERQMGKPFVTLSGGQKQTVVIMRALLHAPALIFLDEPTKGLDPLIARRMRTYLKAYVHEQGKSMLLTSHILSEVDEMADRVVLIQDGRIQLGGTPDQLKASLGARNFIELEKSRLPEAALKQILHLPMACCQIEREPGWISIGVTDTMAGAEAIFGVLNGLGIQSDFRHHPASLEDVFLRQMGGLSERFEA